MAESEKDRCREYPFITLPASVCSRKERSMSGSEYKPKHAKEAVLNNAETKTGKKRRIAETRSGRYHIENSSAEEDPVPEDNHEETSLDTDPSYPKEREEPQEEKAEPEHSEPIDQEKPGEQEKTDSPERRIKLRKILAATAALVFVFSLAASALSGKQKKDDPDGGPANQAQVSSNPMPSDLKRRWTENKEINSDYVGQIVFDSGLVDLAIVHASDVYQDDGTLYEFYTLEGERVIDPEGYSGNDVYIWSDWRTHQFDGYGKDGAVFFDYRNTLNDQNLIIYGHHIARDFDPEGNSEFTPLDVFLKKEGYEENKTLRLILDNEIREYEVVRIFTIDATNYDEIQILRTEFDKDLSGEDDPEFFGRYLEFINSRQKYDTGIEIGADERFLTLITCIQHQPQYRQIIVCKEVERTAFD
jgi:hypothetical protein